MEYYRNNLGRRSCKVPQQNPNPYTLVDSKSKVVTWLDKVCLLDFERDFQVHNFDSRLSSEQLDAITEMYSEELKQFKLVEEDYKPEVVVMNQKSGARPRSLNSEDSDSSSVSNVEIGSVSMSQVTISASWEDGPSSFQSHSKSKSISEVDKEITEDFSYFEEEEEENFYESDISVQDNVQSFQDFDQESDAGKVENEDTEDSKDETTGFKIHGEEASFREVSKIY